MRTTACPIVLGLLVGLWGCGSATKPTPAPGSTGPSASSITISPASAPAGSGDLPLTITGSNFDGEGVIQSQVVWSANGSDTFLTRTVVSSSQITAVVPAALLISPMTAQVRVEAFDQIAQTVNSKSNIVTFSVFAPSAVTSLISSISPASAVPGSPDVELTVTGANFVLPVGSYHFSIAWSVNGNDTYLPAGIVNSTQLTAVIPAALLASPVTAQLQVQLWHKADDMPTRVSNSVSFSVTRTGSGASSGFAPTGSMSTARSAHTGTLLMNGKVLIAGGGDVSAELFDPATGSFAPTGMMGTPRFGATATLLVSGKVLITGGFGPGTSQLPRLDTAELYDPLTGTFSATGSMAVARVLHAATLLNDGNVLITGGTREGGGGGAAIGNAELYDPATGVFTSTGSMISDRAQHTVTPLANGQVLIAGGWNGHRADAADDPPWDPLFAELFHPSSRSFMATGSMRTTRIGHIAIPLANGEVLIFGGIPNPQNLHEQPANPPYAELYDPIAHTFSSVGNLTVSRTEYTATLMTNGMVLLAGGENLGRMLATAELLDLGSGSLTATGGLITARKRHTATLLLDGRVLVTGGVDSNGNVLASAEVYK